MSSTDPTSAMRIGNAERDEAVNRLRTNLDAGRLTQTEFDERTSSALEARTQADLDGLFHDLPRVATSESYAVYPHQTVAVPPDDPDPRPIEQTPAEPTANTAGNFFSQIPSWVWIVIMVSLVGSITAALTTGRAGFWFPWWLIFFIPGIWRRGDRYSERQRERDRRRQYRS